MLPTSVALTTSTRNCPYSDARRPRLISALPVACGLAADVGAGAMAADPGVGWELGSEPEDADPGVGELVEDSCGSGDVEPLLGVPLGEPVSVGVGVPDVDPLGDGVPDGVVLGVPDGEQVGVPVGCGDPPGLPFD